MLRNASAIHVRRSAFAQRLHVRIGVRRGKLGQ